MSTLHLAMLPIFAAHGAASMACMDVGAQGREMRWDGMKWGGVRATSSSLWCWLDPEQGKVLACASAAGWYREAAAQLRQAGSCSFLSCLLPSFTAWLLIRIFTAGSDPAVV